MNTEPGSTAILEQVLESYDLGELASFERNERGFCNTSYAIETRKGGLSRKYFLREYKRGISEQDLAFEHSLISHLVAKGVSLVARVLPTSSGRAYLKRIEDDGEPTPVFYAIFELLTGEDKYTWVDPRCSNQEIVNSAAILARFHAAVTDLVPEGQRAEPTINELLPEITQTVAACPAMTRRTLFDDFLFEHLGLVLDNLKETIEALGSAECHDLPHLAIHCDFHPGNLKFQDGEVVGLFDFDWSKIDVRCFDVALALFYFFVSWDGENDGHLRLGETDLFLQSYQHAMVACPDVGPLTSAELACLPEMLSASNLYVLNWTIQDYYHKQVDAQEYLIYLRHGINLIKWYHHLSVRADLEAFFSKQVLKENDGF